MKRLRILTLILLILSVGAFFATNALRRLRADSTLPQISCGDDVLYLSVEDGRDAMLQGMNAWDGKDGDLTGDIVVERVSGGEFFLFDDERNDARAAELVSGVDGSVGMPRGDHQLVDHVDGVELFHVHAEQAVALGAQLDLALLDLTARHMLIFADGAQALGGVVFMEHSRLHFPDVEMLLAHREQHRNVLFGDDVSLAELRALEFTGYDARQVVAEYMADGIFRFDQLHGISSRTVI